MFLSKLLLKGIMSFSVFSLFLGSPLDQFGADSFGNDLITVLLCSFLE